MKIVLAGNPNSGKTTMYNALTGKNEKVGNWAGVTVDKREHKVKKSFYKGELTVVDLPGAYSMSPFTSEESITSEYVKNEKPSVIINIVDATNLSRSLFFTTQLLELGVPVIVALNKTDVNRKRETVIDINLLSKKLNCPVVETVSIKKSGLKELISKAVKLIDKTQVPPFIGETSVLDKEQAEILDKKRFEFVNEIVTSVERREVFTKDFNRQDKVDALLTNKWLGIPIFAVIMFLVFWISQAGPGVWIAEGYEFSNGVVIPGLVTFIEMFGELVSGWLENSPAILRAIIVDGIIGGVGAVVGFLPLVMVMYFLIALLEDCGYMARATVVLDPIFKKVGLSGKSVIPFVMGTGCAIPGVMACRTIKNEREKKATAMLAPFMPCGAKLPVIVLFAGAFFGESPWVGAIMYFVAIALILVCAYIINLITGCKAKRSYFIIELPEYKAPSISKATISMLERGWSYIVKAGTIILLCNFLVTLMLNFSWSFRLVDNPTNSILHDIATPFAYLFSPITGTVSWQLSASALAGFVAKEEVVGALGTCFSTSLIDGENFAIANGVTGAELAKVLNLTNVSALAYLAFNLFTPPCFAAIGAMRSELNSKKWFWGAIGFQFGIGYSVAFLTFFFGSVFTGGSLGETWMPILGWIVVLSFISVLAVLIIKNRKGK